MSKRVARKIREARKPEGKRPAMPFIQQQQKQAYDEAMGAYERALENNRLVDQRRRMGDAIPFDLIDSDGARWVGDRAVDARNAIGSINGPALVALGAGGTAAGVAGLNAYYQQNAEGLPTDGYNVAGRAINNVISGMGGAVGIDPLAQARNSVREAGAALGSANVLEAVAADELNSMKDALKASDVEALTGPAPLSQGEFIRLVDARAQQLQQVPIQRADGSVAPMGYDSAMRMASEQVYNGLRAEGII